jgi:glycosyltransferase involved in cell wall biosynthesis
LRIGFVIVGDLAHVSGGFLYDRKLIEGLTACGHAVTVIALPWRAYPRALLGNLAPWPVDLRGFDLVVQDELCHPAVFARNRWVRRGVPIVSLVHNLAGCQPATKLAGFVRACERRYFSGVDGVIAVCESTLADVRGCGGGHLPAHVARPAGDHLIVHASAAGQVEALCLLFVGVVAPHKGLHRLVPMLAELPRGVRIDVAGALADRAYLARVRADLMRLGIAERVHFHGTLAPDALAELRARADLFVMPSDREAYPLAALEAMGAGLPVLLTNAGGTPELVRDGAGLLLDPDDRAAWLGAIRDLAENRGRRATMAAAARARHRAHGTWQEMAAGVSRWLTAFV